MIISIQEVNDYIIKRDRNSEWFLLDSIDQEELIQRAIDRTLTTYPLKGDITETNFSDQTEAVQGIIRKVVFELITQSLRGESEIDKLFDKGITSLKDPVSEYTLSKTPYQYRLGSQRIYLLLQPIIKPTHIRTR